MEVVEPRDGKLKRRSTRAGGATSEECCSLRWKRPRVAAASVAVTKEMKGAPAAAAAAGGDGGVDYFDHLPDDLVVCILCKLSSSSTCPSDLISALSTCKRFSVLGLKQMVLAKARARALTVKAKNWSESAHRFLKRCVEAGNLEACFILGMIRFYCLENRGGGASLMAKAAIRSHPAALYSLAIIQFNGSGGTKNDKDLHAGVALCARADYLGYIDALRELGLSPGRLRCTAERCRGTPFLGPSCYSCDQTMVTLSATDIAPTDLTATWRPNVTRMRYILLERTLRSLSVVSELYLSPANKFFLTRLLVGVFLRSRQPLQTTSTEMHSLATEIDGSHASATDRRTLPCTPSHGS